MKTYSCQTEWLFQFPETQLLNYDILHQNDTRNWLWNPTFFSEGNWLIQEERQGISPLCFTPQQAVTACRQSTTLQSLCSVWLAASLTQLLHLLSGSTAFRNLSEHLISTSWLCFPPWWLACVWILTGSTRAISACHSQSSCQLWTEYDFEDCHVL